MASIRKLMLFPITLILSVFIAVFRFVVGISSIILRILMLLCMIGAIGSIVSKEVDLLIGATTLAFLFSPFGIEKLAVWILGCMSYFNESIKNL